MDRAHRAALRERIVHCIEHRGDDFNALAVELFRFQRRANPAYARFVDAMGVEAGTVASWEDIPAVPTDAFRFSTLFCGDPEEARHTFRTSGTTSGQRGEHHLRELHLYHTSARRQLDRCLLPQGPRPALILTPTFAQAPDSSLSSMTSLIAEERAGGDATFCWADGKLDVEAACAWLAQGRQGPVQILTTSFALVHLFDTMEARGMRVSLPEGSIVMPTGGTKGKSREMTPQEVDALIARYLDVRAPNIVTEYGMTELGSQFYDPAYSDSLRGVPPAPQTWGVRLRGPAWCRVTVHDPRTGARLKGAGAVGVLRFFDLSNLDSVCAIQTADFARMLEVDDAGDTFELFGRDEASLPRGCSIGVEEAMEGGERGSA